MAGIVKIIKNNIHFLEITLLTSKLFYVHKWVCELIDLTVLSFMY